MSKRSELPVIDSMHFTQKGRASPPFDIEPEDAADVLWEHETEIVLAAKYGNEANADQAINRLLEVLQSAQEKAAADEVESIELEERPAKYRLDELDATRVARHLAIFHPVESVVIEMMARARLSVPELAETEIVMRVLRHNPGCMYAVTRRSKYDPRHPAGEGFVAILPLNSLGVQQLALGLLNGADPDLRFIARPHERPAGVYLWGVFVPGVLAAGMALFMEKMHAPQFAGVNLYSRPNTKMGTRFIELLGFHHGAQISGIEAPNVWVFPRAQQSPLYDTYVPGSGGTQIGVTLARTFDDLLRVASIRNAVYIGEQECPFAEEYDGNDLSASHLLAYVGDEPVGCLRLRFFAGFAKFERMAIRKEFRRSRAAIQLARAGFAFCQKKGYGRILGHVQEQLVPFWARFGFRLKTDTRRFVFSDVEYVEIVAEVQPDADAVVVDADPYILIRPEGRWHVEGVLEKSAARPPFRDNQMRES